MILKSVESIIKKSVSDILPNEEIKCLTESIINDASPVSIRLNLNKIKSHGLTDAIPWSKSAYYLRERPAFTYDPFLHAGIYYVQEASSMFIEEIFNQLNLCAEPLKILDLCAAPGGKSTLISSIIHPDSILISNEIDKHRCNILSENICKWGNLNTIVSNNKPEDFHLLKNYFDIILADLPCSGEGMFRKDKNSIQEWSEQNVNNCSIKQKKISDEILNALKPGGYYIYSTCTYNKHENENNIDYLIKKHALKSIKIKTGFYKGIHYTETERGAHCYRFFSHKIAGEGFFVSVLQKSETTIKLEKEKNSTQLSKVNNLSSDIINSFELNNLYRYKDCVYMLHENSVKTLHRLAKVLNLQFISTPVFEIKGKDYIPTQAFANSGFNKLKHKESIDYPASIQYLMGNAIQLNCNDSFIALAYKNACLGWIKKIGHRVNNYYPKEWRIKHKNKNENHFLLSDYIEVW